MSHQVCHCGWSKDTTHQGLRIHQGKMGCTPQGMRIPEHAKSNYIPIVPRSPQIHLTNTFMDIFNSSVNSDSSSNQIYYSCPRITADKDLGPTQNQLEENKEQLWRNHQEESHQKYSRPTFSSSVKEENMLLPSSFIPQINPPTRRASVVEIIKALVETQQQFLPTASNVDAYQGLDLGSGAQSVFMPVSLTFSTHSELADSSTKNIETDTSLVETQQQFLPTASNMDAYQGLDLGSGAQSAFMPVSLTFSTHSDLTDNTTKNIETVASFFETPQRSHQSTVSSDKARRALDFSTGGQEVAQLLELPEITAHHAAICPKEKEKEIDRLKEKKTKKQQKARQEKMKSDLQQKIHIRELKVAEVRSSEIDCKGSLDAEWLEVNHFFSEVIRVVEDARRKALNPLEERRQKVKGDAKDIIQKLKREIDVLKTAISELPQNPDLEVFPLTGLNESTEWKNVQVDTSLSFGTLQTTISAMMTQIHEELEKLSSIELRRITKFAVDVKLNPTTAHQSLEIFDNGKKVRDGGKMSKDLDSPQRFNMFGSVLGLNRLTSGRAYWEVEVRNKTGWDLGVTRRDANRKGKLSINPDNGYWVTVHYEDQKYAALTAPPVSLSLKGKPQKVGVFVDYEEGLVSFYDVTSQSHIYSFTECLFGGEILPYFSPHTNQNEKNNNPLIISAVQKQ